MHLPWRFAGLLLGPQHSPQLRTGPPSRILPCDSGPCLRPRGSISRSRGAGPTAAADPPAPRDGRRAPRRLPGSLRTPLRSGPFQGRNRPPPRNFSLECLHPPRTRRQDAKEPPRCPPPSTVNRCPHGCTPCSRRAGSLIGLVSYESQGSIDNRPDEFRSSTLRLGEKHQILSVRSCQAPELLGWKEFGGYDAIRRAPVPDFEQVRSRAILHMAVHKQATGIRDRSGVYSHLSGNVQISVSSNDSRTRHQGPGSRFPGDECDIVSGGSQQGTRGRMPVIVGEFRSREERADQRAGSIVMAQQVVGWMRG